MSRNAFAEIEREYGDRESMRDIEREERQRDREDKEGYAEWMAEKRGKGCQCYGEMPGHCPGPAHCPMCQQEEEE